MMSPDFGNSLVQRLWQRTERPGCVRHSQGPALLARHMRIPAQPSPLAELLLRRGQSGEYSPPDVPVIVAARRTELMPEVVTAPGATPEAPPPTAGSSPAPRPVVAARPGRPADVASAPAIPARPRTRALPSSRAAILRDPAGAEVAGRGSVQRLPDPPAAAPAAARAAAPAAARAAAPAATTNTPAAVVAPVASGTPAQFTGPLAAARPLPRRTEMPADPGPFPSRLPATAPIVRPVVRAGAGSRAPQPPGPGRLPLPVVRERTSHNAGWWPAAATAQRVARLPASAQAGRASPPASADGEPSRAMAVRMAPASDGGSPGRKHDPVGRRADPPGRQEDPARRDRDTSGPATPQIDINRIVTTVQRRLVHHMAIERERRGMMR